MDAGEGEWWIPGELGREIHALRVVLSWRLRSRLGMMNQNRQERCGAELAEL